ncbi:MAG: sulfatase-like hydrolase/transferase [Verrucomicrobia bacterium]|nr:sulfatase-like hydrolase/transferase [Verrucomicrobiota bacterium]
MILRLLLLALLGVLGGNSFAAAPRPNLLWITAEDMSPNLGGYGDKFARSPNLDVFARQAVRYTRAFATAPVCAPSRACLITGLYATSLGNPHLRCEMTIPAEFKGYAAHLRGAGWFTSNNVKTDYNLRDEAAFIRAAWNQSSAQAHWRGRAAGQPFFAVFNLMETHQSRTSVWPWEQFEKEIAAQLSPGERAEPKAVPLPPFYPDTPLARRAMARYYDCIAVMDQKAGRILRELEADGLADDTIVFFYSDHGMGMPRGKRVLHDSGLHVPLLIRFPKKWQHLAPAPPGETVDRLVSFVDFAPTVLGLAGVPVPKPMQGVAFLGAAAGRPREFVVGARDRVDEVIDTARSVRDERWLYIRNYRPHLSWAPPEGYSDQSDFRRELLQMGRAGKLTGGAAQYTSTTRPAEELFDTAADPHQLRNLTGESAHRATLERMRARLHQWQMETRDLGLVPEADMLARAGGESPYEMARRPGKYPVERVLAAAECVGRREAVPQMREALKDADAGVRYWSVVGLRAAGDEAISAKSELEQALKDGAVTVRIEAAGALLERGEHPAALQRLATELRSADGNVALHAARTLELLGARARPILPAMRERLAIAQAAEGKETLAMFIRFALEAALRNLETAAR